MNVEYVGDTSKWEKWQRDYRLGLILIMPPEEVGRQNNPLRARYDPRTYAYCPAHITLSDPLGLEMTPPHMTIAEFVTVEQSWRILEEIKETAPSGSFLCDRLEFIVPDINMHFHRVKSYMFGTV